MLALALALLPFTAKAQRTFTPTEQQQISVRTPGLFDRSDAFNIDFRHLPADGYSFPLPVGKAELKNRQALEITTTPGDAVKAMFAGTVRLSRHTQYGNTIVIRHDNGLETVYGHNAQNLVKVGQRVKAGQTIAIVGGHGGRVYCLFAIMVDGGWINPETILEIHSHRLRSETLQCRRKGAHVEVSVIGGAREDKARTQGHGTSSKGLTLDPDEAEDPFVNSSTFKLDLTAIDNEHWSYPLDGARVISPYGGKRRHSGVDIKKTSRDEVLAAFDGVVTRSSPYAGYGNYIIIRHAYGFTTCYSHQSKNLVKVGQHVKAGQVIGITGRTGRATTEHLHFEVRYKGHAINPAIIFNHATRKLHAKTLTLGKNGTIK